MAIPFKKLGIADGTKPGECWEINFCRSGPTAGGLSTWAPVGNFHNTSNFGKLIFSSRKEYFVDLLKKIKNDIATLALQNKTSAKLAKLQTCTNGFVKKINQLIEQKGNSPAAWNAITNALFNLKGMLIQLRLAGKSYLLWKGKPWGQVQSNEPVPLNVAPMEKISLFAAQNSKLFYGFLLTNLSDKPFMARMKYLQNDKMPRYFNNTLKAGENNFVQRIKLRQSIYVENQSKQMIADCERSSEKRRMWSTEMNPLFSSCF